MVKTLGEQLDVGLSEHREDVIITLFTIMYTVLYYKIEMIIALMCS